MMWQCLGIHSGIDCYSKNDPFALTALCLPMWAALLSEVGISTDLLESYPPEAEIPFLSMEQAAKNYLDGVMNGNKTLPLKAWKDEYAKLTVEQKTLNGRYLVLKGEVKEAEQIRRSVYDILRREQREQQPHKGHDVER